MDQAVETLFSEIEEKIIDSIIKIETEDKIYACGFWLFYCDYSVISPPCFGYNSSYDDEEDRWSPPEWDVEEDDQISEALSPIYEQLGKLMAGKPDEAWVELVKYQWQFYSSLCRRLNEGMSSMESPFHSWSKSGDFVVGIFEEREGEEIFEKLVIDSLGYETAKALCVI